MKLKHYLVTAIILLAIGFFAGRLTIKTPDPKIEYVQLPEITDTLASSDLRPVSEDLSDSIVYVIQYKEVPVIIDYGAPDTVIRYVTVVDTLASLKKTVEDWNISRTYRNNLFDKENIGKLDYTATVQYNTLTSLSYNFVPVQRIETVVKPRAAIEPFLRASYNSFEQATIGGGLYIKHFGIDGFYIKDTKLQQDGFGIGLSYKF